ncbi:MAG: 4Fe-4S binding protein [Holosporales bacterium]|nr:4Fe-4S binding protein [Holosporales bacterium]
MIRKLVKIFVPMDIFRALAVGIKCCFRKPVTNRADPRSWSSHRVLTVSSELCVGCKACENICPCGVIKIKAAGEYSWNAGRCAFCRLCMRACKSKAITFCSCNDPTAT